MDPALIEIAGKLAHKRNPRVEPYFKQWIVTFTHPRKGGYVWTKRGKLKQAHRNDEPMKFGSQAEAEKEARDVVIPHIRKGNVDLVDYISETTRHGRTVMNEDRRAFRQLAGLRHLNEDDDQWDRFRGLDEEPDRLVIYHGGQKRSEARDAAHAATIVKTMLAAGQTNIFIAAKGHKKTIASFKSWAKAHGDEMMGEGLDEGWSGFVDSSTGKERASLRLSPAGGLNLSAVAMETRAGWFVEIVGGGSTIARNPRGEKSKELAAKKAHVALLKALAPLLHP